MARARRSPRCCSGGCPAPASGFAKILGLLLVTWLIWMAASLHVVAYGVPLIVGVLVLLAIAGLLVRRPAARVGRAAREARQGRRATRLAAARAAARGPRAPRGCSWAARPCSPSPTRSGSLLASFAPDVWNTEKPMDMGFINAINASAALPAARPVDERRDAQLLLPRPRRAGLADQAARRCAPDAGYLLCWGLLLALTADGRLHVRGHAVGGGAARRCGERAPRGGPVLAGLIAAALVRRARQPGRRAHVAARRQPAARLRLVRPLAGDPEHDQRVPVRSRSSLGDLHAHVLALPFTRAGAGVRAAGRAAPGRAATSSGAGRPRRWPPALAVGALYAINSWSYPVAAGLLVAAVIVWLRRPGAAAAGAATRACWLVLVLIASIVLDAAVLARTSRRRPRASASCTRGAPFTKWLGDMALIYGILLWPLSRRVRAPRCCDCAHRWRWLGWGAVGRVVAGSLLAAGRPHRRARAGRRRGVGDRRGDRRPALGARSASCGC